MNQIYAIIQEVRQLFHTMSNVAEAAHRDLNITPSQRAVLEALADSTDQTVPAVARSKGVTRQHIQALANQLLEAGLIEQRNNPAHRRSPILVLTAAGRDCFAEIRKREKRLLRAMAPKFRRHDLTSVVRCLREMNAHFKSTIPVDHSSDTARSKRRK